MKEIIDKIIKDGYAVVKSVLTEEQVTSYKKKVETVWNGYSEFHAVAANAQKFHGGNQSKMVYNLHNKDISFVELIDHPIVMEVADTLLKEGSYKDCEPYILRLTSARSPGPYSAKQQLHIDSNIPGLSSCLVLQTAWLLDDFTDKNGPTRVVPGSHRFSSFAEDNKSYDGEILVTAPKGSLVFFHGGIWHGSGENNTDQDRWAILNSYTRWFCKPAFDMCKNTTKEIYDQLNDVQKSLLGFKCLPPLDEFTRVTTKNPDNEGPFPYYLPK